MSSRSKTSLRCLDELSQMVNLRRSKRTKTDPKLKMNQLKRIIGLSGRNKCNLMNMIKELDVMLKNPEIVNLKNLTAMWKSANTIPKNVKELIATSPGSNPRLISFARMLEQKISVLKNKITRLLIKHRYLIIKKERGGNRFRRTGPASYHAIQKIEAFNEMQKRALEMIIEQEEEEDTPVAGCRNHRDLGGVPFSGENPPVFREPPYSAGTEIPSYCFSQNDLAGSKNTLIGKMEGIGGYLPTNLFLKNPYTNQKFNNLPVNNRMFELMYGVGKEGRTQAENNELLGLLGYNDDEINMMIDYDEEEGRLGGAEFTIDLTRYLQTNPAIQQEYIRVADEIPIGGAYWYRMDGQRVRNFEIGFIPADQLGHILAKMRTDGVDFILPGETPGRRATPELLRVGNRLNIHEPDSDDENMSFRMRSGQKHLDQKMLKELKLLQQEVSTINKHRISHLKSQHKRLQKRIVKGLPVNYDKYKKNVNTRMKQRLKRVDKSLNVYEKATKKRSRKVSRKSSRKRRSVKRKVSRKRRSVMKRKASRKRRSVKRKVSRKRRSAKRKVSRKRRSVKRKASRKRRSVKRKSRKRQSVKRKSRKSSRKRRSVKKKR